jgi:hypothetical protein
MMGNHVRQAEQRAVVAGSGLLLQKTRCGDGLSGIE